MTEKFRMNENAQKKKQSTISHMSPRIKQKDYLESHSFRWQPQLYIKNANVKGMSDSIRKLDMALSSSCNQ